MIARGAALPIVEKHVPAGVPFKTAPAEPGTVEEAALSDSDLAEWRAELLDADSWGEILGNYGRTVKLAVALTDVHGNLIGPCHNPQPVWSLARTGAAESGTGQSGLVESSPVCAFCLAPPAPCNAVVAALVAGEAVFVDDQAGLTHVAIPLFLGTRPLGALIAGQIFGQYPQPLAVRRAARSCGVSQQDLWNVAVRQIPVSKVTLRLYADLLTSLGHAFLQQRYAAILDRKLRETNQRYRLMIEGLNDYALFTVDDKGCVTSWNAGAELLLGYTESEVRGQDYRRFFTPEDARSGIPKSKIRLAEQIGWIEEERWQVRRNGTRFLAEIVTARLGEGEKREYGRLLHDVTETRKATAAALEGQKLESLGVLAAGIAHDFNNLLTGILGGVSLAMAKIPEDDPTHRLLVIAEASGFKAAALVAQLLAYAGKGQIAVTQFDLSGLVSEILPLIGTSIPKIVQMNLSLSPDLPRIEADSTAVQQIIMNLIINAAESVGPEGGSVNVSTGVAPLNVRAKSRLDGVYLEVRDSGCGMDDATKRRIFDPFFTTKFIGRGLGLSAVSGIVRRLGARLDVKSALGAGSTFRVVFPGVTAPLPAPEPLVKNVLRGKGIILVVDDDPLVRKLSTAILERLGYSVLTAENGQTGVEAFRSNMDTITAVLLDLTMPVMGGREALRQMNDIRADIPIVISTGYGDPDDFDQFGYASGGILQKPFTVPQLGRKMAEVVALRKTAESKTSGAR